MYSAVHCCMCLTPLPPARATGRPQLYCRPACRQALYEFKRKSRFIGGYKCIVADPPWDFNGAVSIARRSVHRHFPTMPLAATKALPVGELAARDCALFLWMIDTHEAEAREVIQAWGFTFKTRGFEWIKLSLEDQPRIGGDWATRAGSEQCWLATRAPPERQAKDVRRIVFARAREPHRKPAKVYTEVQRLYPGPYLELFARCRRPGWNQVFSPEADMFATP